MEASGAGNTAAEADALAQPRRTMVEEVLLMPSGGALGGEN